MERRFSLLDGRGWLKVREEGGRAACEAVLPDQGRGLYKCWLLGPSGRYLLGPFLPEGGELRLSRAPETAARFPANLIGTLWGLEPVPLYGPSETGRDAAGNASAMVSWPNGS